MRFGKRHQAQLPAPIAAERQQPRDQVVPIGDYVKQPPDVKRLRLGARQRAAQAGSHVRDYIFRQAMPPLSSTVENYLKAIFEAQLPLPRKSDLVTMGQVAAALGVVAGTATTMVKALSDSGLVKYEPYEGVRLTPSGERVAAAVIRRHRLIERFLVEVMGMSWSEVHDEAEHLEHAMSDRLIDRIHERLGRPAVNPHDDPIPEACILAAKRQSRE